MNPKQKPVIQNRTALRVLFIEDSEPDAILLNRALNRGGFDTVTERVWTAEDLTRVLKSGKWDVILADHTMPTFSSPEALEIVKGQGLDIPFIIVSGHIEEETAVAAMNAGAHDYIMKDKLARLVPVIQRELREAEVRQARTRSEHALQRAHSELEQRVEQRTADLREANAKLQSMLADRRRLEAELLEIAEKERRRIGFDLHDDLGQKLTGASMMVKALEHKLTAQKHPAAPDACKISELMDQIVYHTHNLAHEFGSLSAKGDDLGTVLKSLAASVRKMFDVECSFSCKGEIPDLPENTCTQLYKIAQEAVSNAIKHGKATHVVIAVECKNKNCLVTVRNDGMPFGEPAAAKDRMGLKIMSYRASIIGGTLEIEALEEGTLVSCAFPIHAEANPSRRNGRSGEPKLHASLSS